jgi:uncharacterized RDD family membrane protein YckC
VGQYLPAQRKRKRSVADTLAEAEQEHYLDCPNADLPIRSAALLLDLILFSLGTSGIHHLVETVKNSVPSLIGVVSEPAGPTVVLAITYLSWLIKSAALFLFFVWTVLRFGGSPAKLLMGLRVVDARTGDRLDYRQALIRETVGKILGSAVIVGPAVALFRRDRRALHDLASHSVVKRVRGVP